jgi:translocation and assembly module TamA
VLALVAGAQTACVHIRGTEQQPAILRFRIEGMKHLDEGDLKKRLATQESERSPPIPIIGPMLHQLQGARQDLAELKSPPPVPIFGPLVYALRGSGQNDMVSLLDPDRLAVDRERVLAYYRDRGYYDAKLVDAQVVAVGEGQAAVTLKVEEGQPVRVTRIDVEGLEGAPEARAAVKKPALRVGDVFAVEAYDSLREQLVAALHDNGWATGEVTHEAQVLPDEHAAIVHYRVEPGLRFRFGPILVAGTGKVPRERVREQAADEIKSGDWYDDSKLAQAQTHVFAMGVFGGVRVSAGTPDPQRGIIPILVAVREAPFRSVRLGPSLGVVSSNRIDLSGVAGWTNRNFVGGLRKLDLSLTAGYAWLVTPPEAQGPVAILAADFTQPAVLTRKVDLRFYSEVRRGLESGYQFWAQRGRLSLAYRITRRVTFVPSYNLEVYELDHVSAQPNPNDPNHPLPSPLLTSCEYGSSSSTHGVCLLSYLEQRLEWDGRDDPLNTRRGFYTVLSVQEGGHVGGYGYQFVKVVPEGRIYLPVGERSVLAARVRLGAFIPVNETRTPPTVALFESGGADAMRGYGQNRLSPMACVLTVPSDANGNPLPPVCTGQWYPVGGNGLAEYSVEYRFPLHGNLFGAVFTDAGYVSAPSAVPTSYRDALNPARLQWAAGIGIRYRTPVGPLRVDIAGRLPDDLSPGLSFEDRFPTVPLTPHHEPVVAFHLTIGEAY